MRKRAAFASLLLSACAVGPDYVAPSVDVPSQWNTETPTAEAASAPLSAQWWMVFNDPTLAALVDEALVANSDLSIAAARVAEARANLRLTDADLYPRLDGEVNATRTGNSQETALANSGKPYNDFNAAAVLSYEVDLWGRLRRADEASRAQLLSIEANREAIRNALVSDMATGYFNLMAIDTQIAVTHETVASRQATYDYTSRQYRGGAIDALTFRQTEAELASAKAALPALEQARTEQETSLAVLMGRSPKALTESAVARGASLTALPVPPAVPVALPSSLLQRRPDIVAAEQALIAANAEIGVATAEYFPKLSLSALVGLDAAQTGNLLQRSARNWQMGAGLAAPLFDAGRTRAHVDATSARAEQARIAYQQTVRTAFAEVVNALSAIRTTQAQVEANAAQVVARSEAQRIAKRRYEAGYSAQLELLDVERNLYTAQQAEIAARSDRLSAYATLYKALGGGWLPYTTQQ